MKIRTGEIGRESAVSWRAVRDDLGIETDPATPSFERVERESSKPRVPRLEHRNEGTGVIVWLFVAIVVAGLIVWGCL